ncbi:MAG TPA: bifunctional 4-hydroxy-2-oxoglutarate aldolase/2-dehydro-3-deoxy-phosphogluconate aldolase [Thermoanaerobaculia bacterium]|nr:bifunctional 4-hydroxy-2-oxoglutarate aldolase/2-dehydro-3-deoxy-phosphogluconate aldolase [Thermoanaerobaculia bacterium]
MRSDQGQLKGSERLTRHPLIPVIVIEDENDAVPLAEALLAGGLDVIEVTLRTATAMAALARIIRRFPEMMVGAGTVVTPEQAQRCLDLGVSFGVAPGFNPATLLRFQRDGVPFLPGVLTPSEIESAYSHGCTRLKYFPAEAAGGPKMLRALAGPYESLGIRFCPTGGITFDNMNDYLSLAQVFAVGGSWLASQRQIAEKQWSVITRQTREALSRANEVAS